MRQLIPSLTALCVLAGCATSHNNYDPLEAVNRPVFAFNRGVDKVVIRPLAVTWKTVTPGPVQTGVHNFFENISDVFAIPAAILQGKGEDASNSFGRVVVNTTMGLAGLIDVGTAFNIPKSQEDFGQALGYWGVPTGPYLMLPLLGPSTLRDTVDPAVRFVAGPANYLSPESARYIYMGMNAIDSRSQILSLDSMVDEQYDPYAFVRDTYLQRRWFKVYDGEPPHPLPMGDDEAQSDNSPALVTEARQTTPNDEEVKP